MCGKHITTQGKTHFVDPRWVPRSTRDGPKTAPRRSSTASFFVLVFVFDVGAFWVPYWSHFRLQNRAKFRASTGLVELKKTKVDPWAPKMPQEPPKRHPRPPKIAKDLPRPPENGPRCSQDAPKRPQIVPRCPQDPLSPAVCLVLLRFLSFSLFSLSLSLLLFCLPSLFSLFSLLSLLFSSLLFTPSST